jgi:hypothetical protein
VHDIKLREPMDVIGPTMFTDVRAGHCKQKALGIAFIRIGMLILMRLIHAAK